MIGTERSERTHTLVIRVPMRISADRDYGYEPLREVLRAVVPLLRVATDDVICDDLDLEVVDVRDALRTHYTDCLSLLPDFDRRDCTCSEGPRR